MFDSLHEQNLYESVSTDVCESVDEICIHVSEQLDEEGGVYYIVYPRFKFENWPVNDMIIDAADDFYALLTDTAATADAVDAVVQRVITAAEDFLELYADEIDAAVDAVQAGY